RRSVRTPVVFACPSTCPSLPADGRQPYAAQPSPVQNSHSASIPSGSYLRPPASSDRSLAAFAHPLSVRCARLIAGPVNCPVAAARSADVPTRVLVPLLRGVASPVPSAVRKTVTASAAAYSGAAPVPAAASPALSISSTLHPSPGRVSHWKPAADPSHIDFSPCPTRGRKGSPDRAPCPVPT